MPDDKVIKSLKEDEGYKYLGVLQADEVQVEELKGKIGSEYKRRVRKILEAKLNGGNVIKGINTWAICKFLGMGYFDLFANVCYVIPKIHL